MPIVSDNSLVILLGSLGPGTLSRFEMTGLLWGNDLATAELQCFRPRRTGWVAALTYGGGIRLAGSADLGEGAGWRVFISHTSELRDFPAGTSYVAAVERAISAAGHVIVDMADFPAADQAPAELCAERVRGCDVYVGVLGTRYGSPVRDRPEVSYTELEFDTATEAGLDRLVFLLDTDADDVGIPLSKLIDREFGDRQDAFRRRVRDSGLTTQSFANPDALRRLVETRCGIWPTRGGGSAAGSSGSRSRPSRSRYGRRSSSTRRRRSRRSGSRTGRWRPACWASM